MPNVLGSTATAMLASSLSCAGGMVQVQTSHKPLVGQGGGRLLDEKIHHKALEHEQIIHPTWGHIITLCKTFLS